MFEPMPFVIITTLWENSSSFYIQIHVIYPNRIVRKTSLFFVANWNTKGQTQAITDTSYGQLGNLQVCFPKKIFLEVDRRF